MKLIQVTYEGTVYHRTCDSFDDNHHSHTSVDKQTLTVLAADDHPGTIAMVETHCDHYGGNMRDTAYRRLSTEVLPLRVDRIFYSPKGQI